MTYSCSDLAEHAANLLEDKGYRIHNGNAETGETFDDESGNDWWFSWTDGNVDVECGSTCNSSLEATAEALFHFFANATIPVDTLTFSTKEKA